MEQVGIFPARQKTKNRVRCGVRDCKSKANKDLNLIFHSFPKPGDRPVGVTNYFGNVEKVDKFKAWKTILKLNKVPPRMKICSLHFKKNDYILPDYNLQSKFLKKIAIPSCNLPGSSGTTNTVENEPRLQRKLQRDKQKKLKKQNFPVDQTSIELDKSVTKTETKTVIRTDDELVGRKEAASSKAELTVNFDKTLSTSRNDIGVQVETKFFTPRFMDLITSENDFSTATGIQSFQILETIVGFVKMVYGERLSNCKMTLRERIIMTYIKLKQNLSFTFLALIFKQCSAIHCRRIFYITLEMLSKCLKVVLPWPSKKEISKNLPNSFKDFEDTRVVVDCTEIFIQPPNNVCCQEITYSNNKSSTTCKIMIGVTPGGIISYCSAPYGGKTTDSTIFEQSDLTQFLEPGDAVMTDRGFLIDEFCDRNNWKLIRPPFMEDKKQFSKDEAILTSKIAKARVNVERINERIKAFSILGGTMSVKLLPVLNEIFTVVCGTVNLSSPIFADDKFMRK